jgi:hypothetical protein
MRRLCLILLVSALVGAPAALAAPRAAGDGTFAGAKIYGTVTIAGRGVIWGAVDSGTITVTDRDPTDGTVRVNGWEELKLAFPNANSTQYTGDGLRFVLSNGGPYRLTITGKGIAFSAVGAGRVFLNGSDTAANPGRFMIGDDSWQPVPLLPTWYTFPLPTGP